MPDKPYPNEYDRYRDWQRSPDPALPVAATIAGTYSCSMPYPMFRKLFNQEQLPNGFTIAFEYGHESFLVTYDPTADIPRHPDVEPTDVSHSSNCSSRTGGLCDCEDM